MFRIFALIALSPALLLAGPASTSNPIPRFNKVSDGLFRGGQPDRHGFEFLRQQGVKTVINLKEENDEEAVVRSLGMNYVHIPMSVTVWTQISLSDIQQYFKVLSDPANLPVYVHCQRGADRTGAMVGFYRIAFQSWNGPRAFKEAREIGMRWWYAGLKTQLHAFKPEPFLPITTTASAVLPN